MLKTVTLPSLYKTYPDFCPEDKAKNNFTCLLNEPLSFSVAYILTEGRNPKGINLRIESDLPISFYYAEYVPLLRNNPAPLAKPSKQGLHPDILIPKKVNPTIQAGNYQLSGGTSYLVYPARGLDCYQSIRQKIFYEGILDHRALMTLEKLRGKEIAMEIVKKHFGEVTFETAPDSAEALLAFREEVNRELEW